MSLCAALAGYPQDQPILLTILGQEIIGENTWTRTEETGLRIPPKPSLALRGREAKHQDQLVLMPHLRFNFSGNSASSSSPRPRPSNDTKTR